MFDTLILETLFIGHQHLHFDELPSTNDHLKKLIDKGGHSEGVVVSTDYQTSGRGQIGNQWVSEPGKNLLFSVFLKPLTLNARHFFYFNMSVCLAVADALNELTPGFKIKWPNDILFNGKKISGILIENTIAGGQLQTSVVGIGINVNQRHFDTDNKARASSLRQILKREVSRDYVLKLVLKYLEVRYLALMKGGGNLRKDYFDMLHGYRETLPAFIDDQKVSATITDVLADGQLVASINGTLRKFMFKEISFEY